ncbi:type II toxin-antitoxin system HicB family antitoxin [Aerococcaceae bacterium WGS1372]
MLYIFPGLLHEEDGYWIEFPDLPGCSTQGDSLEELLINSREAMEGYILDLLENGDNVPSASHVSELDSSEASPILIETDVDLSKRTKSVKKTLTIPLWLNEQALSKNINFSKVLQESLIEKIGQ